ncbi:ATP-binding protein [Desulfococcaceae bacterium HSG8]|nr:ATP-binding protein [Desulfococcaceae bacterium HSG8]
MSITAMLVGTMHVFIYRNFADYVNQVELSKLNNLVAALEEEYVKDEGWDSLRKNPGLWNDIVSFNLLKDHPKPVHVRRNQGAMRRRPPPRDDKESRGDKRKPPPPGDGRRRRPPPRDDAEPRGDRRRPPPPGDERMRRPPPRDGSRGRRPPSVDPLQTGRRLSLFDKELRHVAGRESRDERHTFREITVNGNPVGWLGLNITKEMYHPLALGYIKKQIHAFYIIGCGMIIFSAFLSFLISGQLLRPIRQLMKGTQALTSFRFNTKIEVRTKDELGKLADDFNRMAETLKKYEEMRQQWISNISHELRTPLTIMRGKIEATLDGIRELTEDTMVSLHSDVIRLGKLVDDLHMLSLADSRNLHTRKEPLNLSEPLKDTLDSFQTMLDNHEIRVEDHVRGEERIIMKGDRDRLCRLFSNLLENTLRYTDSPGVMKIHTAFGKSKVIICFEDSAPGVPDESLTQIFERLYRVDKSRSRKLGGSGLGLSICKQIVESHNGTIEADHSSLGGLQITLEFPLISDKLNER